MTDSLEKILELLDKASASRGDPPDDEPTRRVLRLVLSRGSISLDEVLLLSIEDISSFGNALWYSLITSTSRGRFIVSLRGMEFLEKDFSPKQNINK